MQKVPFKSFVSKYEVVEFILCSHKKTESADGVCSNAFTKREVEACDSMDLSEH